MVIKTSLKCGDGMYFDTDVIGIYLKGKSFKFAYTYWVSVFRQCYRKLWIDADDMSVLIESDKGFCYLRLKPLRHYIFI